VQLLKLAGSSWGASTETLLWLFATLWQSIVPQFGHSLLALGWLRLISGTLRSTPLPWLPVLANIEPPLLRRKAATDKLMKKITCTAHDSWPIHCDITDPPHACLPSWKPLWQDLVHLDTGSQWKETGSQLRWSTFP